MGDALKEQIARVIDPEAFLPEFRRPDYALETQTIALTKANRILALLSALTPSDTWQDISTDGPHEIGDHRRWLARQLMDSKNSDAEAFGIVAFHPSIREHRGDDR